MIEQKEERSNQKIFLRPYWIVLLLAIVIFISEAIVMMIISLMPPLPVLQEALVDSLMLVTLLSPALFFFLFKPIILEIKKRKRLEDDVRKKEERNRLILESIPEMFFILNTDGLFTGFKEMKGIKPLMPPEDFIGKKASDVLPTKLAEETLKHIELALRNETTQLFEYELPLKGILHNYEAKISRISADEVLCIVRDITERKRGEEALREGEQFLESIFASIQDGIGVIDSDMNIIRVNKTAESWYPYAIPLVGKKCYEAYHNRKERCEQCPAWETLKTGKSAYKEIPKHGPEGKKVGWLEIYSYPLTDTTTGKMKGVIEYVRDITERKRAEYLLQESEAKFRTIFEGAAIGMALIEFNGQSKTSNPTLQRMLGYGSEELTFELISELTHPEDREADLKLFNEMSEGKRDSYRIEKRYIRKDGTIILGQLTVSLVRGEDNEPRFVVSMVEDITERKLAEEALRESEERYRRIVETSTEGIWVADASSKTTYVNSRMAQMLGYTEEEMLGRHVFDFMDADARIVAEKYLERFKQGIKETLDFRLSRKDGINLWVIVSTNPIFNDKGQYVGTLGMFTDISERKQAEEKIEASLKEKEILLREIHHRVKNNMQIISSLLGLASGTIHEKKYIEMFRESQNRINSMSLIHEKLYRSKDLTKIDFNEYIRELANSLFKSRGITGKIELKINIENVSLGTDHAIHCGLIINELITNSIKYAFPGERKGEIKISLHLNDENMNELIVSDNGVGIPEDVDFRKTESLGLRLVTILVENQLDGRIDLDRSNGTEFKIKFKRE